MNIVHSNYNERVIVLEREKGVATRKIMSLKTRMTMLEAESRPGVEKVDKSAQVYLWDLQPEIIQEELDGYTKETEKFIVGGRSSELKEWTYDTINAILGSKALADYCNLMRIDILCTLKEFLPGYILTLMGDRDFGLAFLKDFLYSLLAQLPKDMN